jgi:uroporphyrinogen decarboxylase
MSLDMYRSRVKPYHRKHIDFVKSHTSAAISYHCCGNMTNLIDDLVEIGVDAINPVHVSAMAETATLLR